MKPHVNGSRARRFAAALSATLLGLMVLGPGATFAATPGWERSNAVNIVNPVGPGKDAGYDISIYNDGPGNISALFLVTTNDFTDVPSFISDSRCNQTGTLFCSFGALNVGQEIHLKVAYTVPNSTGTYSPPFVLNTNGNTLSDKGHNSRGDSKQLLVSTTITTGGGNFDAGWNVGDDTYSTDQAVTKNNVQATKLQNAPNLTAVTIQDGITSFTCQTGVTQCSRLVGEWSKLTVGAGTEGPFKVTVLIYGKALQGNPDASSLFLVHTNDNGTTNVITQQCTFDTAGLPTNADCLAGVPTKVGTNYQIVAWLAHNGAVRGGV